MTVYYKRIVVDPDTLKYDKLAGVYRRADTAPWNPERWNGKEWKDYPPLYDASGINGDDDYHVITEDEATMLMGVAETKARKPSKQAVAIAEAADKKRVTPELVQSAFIDTWRKSTMGLPESDLLQKVAARTFGHNAPKSLGDVEMNWDLLYPMGALYNITQEALKKRGYTREETIPVYHPYVPKEGVPKTWAKGDEVRIYVNPLTSWTTSIQEAAQYASFLSSPGSPGFVLKSYVPMSSIVSTPRTGIGEPDTHEVVLAGGEYVALVELRFQ
jgi:hypothetical protein